MKQIRWLIFTILFLAVVAAGMATSFNLGCRASVLNPDFYKEQFSQHNVYNLSQRYVLLRFRSEMNQQLAEPIRDALTHAVEQSFTPEWTRQESSRLIENFLSYLTNQKAELDLVIDLGSRKNLLLHAMNHQIDALTVSDSPVLHIISLQTKQLLEMMGQYLDLPDRIDLGASGFFAKAEVQQHMLAFKHYYRFTPFLPYLLLFLLVALLFTKGMAGGFKWFGLGIALSSILFMVLLTAAGEVSNHIILRLSDNTELISIGADPVLLANLLKEAIIAAHLKAALVIGLPGALLAASGWLWEHWQDPSSTHKVES